MGAHAKENKNDCPKRQKSDSTRARTADLLRPNNDILLSKRATDCAIEPVVVEPMKAIRQAGIYNAARAALQDQMGLLILL